MDSRAQRFASENARGPAITARCQASSRECVPFQPPRLSSVAFTQKPIHTRKRFRPPEHSLRQGRCWLNTPDGLSAASQCLVAVTKKGRASMRWVG